MRKFLIGLFALISSFIGTAYAALPADVATAISAAKADGIELAGLLLSLAVAVGVILWLKRKA